MSRFGIRSFRLALIAAGFLAVAASGAEETAFTVTALPLGTDLKRETTGAGIRTFVSRLDGRDGFAAALAKAPEKWDACPAGLEPERWVSLVPACFGARTDWLAFAFDAEGRPAYAVRRPARQYDTTGIFPENIAPGDRQIDRNAGIELAADWALARPKAGAGRPPLRIDVTAGKADSEQALPMMPAELEGIRALATAAALQAEAPSAGDPWTLTVSKSDSGYRLELFKPGRKGALPARVPREALYPYLVRMIRSISEWERGSSASNTVADFMLVEPGGARVMGWTEGRAFFDLGDSVVAVSAVEGLIEWTATVDARYNPAYTWARETGSPSSGRPYSYRPAVAVIGKNGEIARGPAGSEAMPWGFARLADGGYLVAQGEALMNTDPRKYTARWTWAGADRLTAGPLVSGDRVLAGGLSGELAALKIADGSPVWKTSVAARLSGPMAWTLTEPSFALASSLEGILFAFDGETGKVAWQAELGDTLLGAPVSTKAGLLAATRAGRVALLDPRNGKVLASWEAGVECAGWSVMGDRIGWAGRLGRVVWLDLPGLAVRRDVDLHVLLNDGMVAGEGIPYTWGAGDEITLQGPAALVADEEGFVYVLPVP